MNIYQKLAAVRDEVKYIKKTGYNSFHKYSYAKEGDYLEAVRPALQKQGLVCYPSKQTIGYHPTNPELVLVEMEYTFVNTESPEEKVVVPASGQGADKGDKAVYKAITGAKKYLLSTLFLIETGDDAEADEDTDKRATLPSASATAKSTWKRLAPAAEEAKAVVAKVLKEEGY